MKGAVFLGLIAYADDHVLLMPSLHALESSLNLIMTFAKHLNLSFNPSKSILVKFHNKRFVSSVITVANITFDVRNSANYLGNITSYNLKDNETISSLRNNAIWRGNATIQGLKTCHPNPVCGFEIQIA